MLDKAIDVSKVYDSAKPQREGGFARVTVYEFFIGKHGPFREEFMVNEQQSEHVQRVLNQRAAAMREHGIKIDKES